MSSSSPSEVKPYLLFNGNCREALEFYQQCLGGQLQILTFAGTPMETGMKKESVNNVMHGTLELSPTCRIMASDNVHEPVEFGDNVALSLNFSTDAQITNAYEKLSNGGSIIHTLNDQFWGGKFGQFTDKFGVVWMCHLSLQPKSEDVKSVNTSPNSKKRKLDTEENSEEDMTGVTILPYLKFNGNCREIMSWYSTVLGGTYDAKGFEGTPMDKELTAEQLQNYVMHSTLVLSSNKSGSSSDMMASDCASFSSHGGSPVKMGSNAALSALFTDDAAIKAAFDLLSEGGKVIQAPQVMFWGAMFGQFFDKYGFQWIFVGSHGEGKDCSGDEV